MPLHVVAQADRGVEGLQAQVALVCAAARCRGLTLATLFCDLAPELDDGLRILALELLVSDGLAGPLRSCCLVKLPPVELQLCRAGHRVVELGLL